MQAAAGRAGGDRCRRVRRATGWPLPLRKVRHASYTSQARWLGVIRLRCCTAGASRDWWVSTTPAGTRDVPPVPHKSRGSLRVPHPAFAIVYPVGHQVEQGRVQGRPDLLWKRRASRPSFGTEPYHTSIHTLKTRLGCVDDVRHLILRCCVLDYHMHYYVE